LAAFPALFSTYIRVIPHSAFVNEDTGNNAYLNLFVEQGVLGIASYVIIISIAIIQAMQRYDQVSEGHQRFVIAGILGLGFILLHGFVHATLAASRAIPALLIPAGLALSGPTISNTEQNSFARNRNSIIDPRLLQSGRSRKNALVALLLALSLVSFYAFRSSLLSSWYADLGAVQMAHIELADFPSGKWSDGSRVAKLSGPKNLFQIALHHNADNRTAHHRLGLIRMEERNFEAACDHLQSALDHDSGHRGVNKSLGYCYTWLGRSQEAERLLASIPEAAYEMSVYEWWWGRMGRYDLSKYAADMSSRLKSSD